MRHGIAALVLTTAAETALACGVGDIGIKIETLEWVDKCRASECIYMQGTATLTNSCKHPVGVEVSATAYDKAGKPIRSRTFWPNSISNFPPGENVISLDLLFDHDPRITTLKMKAVSVRRR